MRKTYDCIHHYRGGHWSDGGKCRIQICREDDRTPVVVCSQLLDNSNTSVTNVWRYKVESPRWSPLRAAGLGAFV